MSLRGGADGVVRLRGRFVADDGRRVIARVTSCQERRIEVGDRVPQMLSFLAMRGEVAISGRRGRQRVWDLAERVYPAGAEAVPLAVAHRIRSERRLRSLGIVRAAAAADGVGEPATVEGVPGPWRVDPAAVGQRFTGRTALLSPFGCA